MLGYIRGPPRRGAGTPLPFRASQHVPAAALPAEQGTSIYHERQEDDLCRMHGLNHFAQRRAFDKAAFVELLRAFHTTHPELPDPHTADAVDASQEYVTTFGVERLTDGGSTTFSLPMFGKEAAQAMLGAETVDELVDPELGLFLFSPDHIWYAVAHPDKPGKWLCLDSLKPGPQVLPSLRHLLNRSRRHGLMLVWGRARVELALKQLAGYLRRLVDPLTPEQYVQECVLGCRDLLGPLEIPLILFCRYHDFLYNSKYGEEFLTRFEKCPNDQTNFAMHLPVLLNEITNLVP